MYSVDITLLYPDNHVSYSKEKNAHTQKHRNFLSSILHEFISVTYVNLAQFLLWRTKQLTDVVSTRVSGQLCLV